MLNPLSTLRRFLREEDGPTAAEYAVLVALLVIMCVLVIRAIGDSNADVPESTAIAATSRG